MSLPSPLQARRAETWLTPAESSPRLGLLLLGVILFATFSVSYENFFSIDNVQSIALNISSIALAAVGSMLLVASGRVDLSIGSQFALVSIVVASTVHFTQNVLLGVVVALAAGGLLGLVNGLLVHVLSLSPLIVTLGTLAIYRGMAFAISNGLPVSGFPDSFAWIGASKLMGIPTPIVVAAIVFVIGSVFLLKTVAGLRLYAMGGDEEASRRVGVATNRTAIRIFAANGAIVGLAALLSVARLSSGSPQVGVQFELDVLTAVILGGFAFTGGLGHPLGVASGVVTIGILNAGLIFAGLADFYQQIAKGALLLLALGADQVLGRYRQRKQERGAALSRESISGTVQSQSLRSGRQIGEVILDARDLSVRFGNVEALRSASLTVRAGEVVCLLGDNGAGKSTLIKVLAGVTSASDGAVSIDGREVRLETPADARSAGIETVFQDLALCSNLGVAHNLVLGSEPTRRWWGLPGMRDDRAASALARERLSKLNVPIQQLNRPIGTFSGGQKQSVAIARVLRDDVRLVILDEPTAALGVAQTAQVLKLVADIARQGHGVILITHDVEQVLDVADRAVVMRLGAVIYDGPAAGLSPLDLMELMAGFRDASPASVPPKDSLPEPNAPATQVGSPS